MSKFYENIFNYKEVYELFNQIITRLESKNVNFYVEKIDELNTPTFKSEIIPLLKKLYPNNIILEETIAEYLKIESFNNHVVKDIENTIFKDNYIIIDNIIFFINPLSVEASAIIEGFKDYGDNELLFNKFGIVFEDQVKDLINKKNLIIKDKKFDINDLSMEKIFKDIIKTSIEKGASRLKIFLDSNSIKIQFFIDGQYIKNKELTILNINNYEKFKNLISEKFKEDNFLSWKYNTSFYNILLTKNKDEIYLDIHDLNKKIYDINDFNLNEKDMFAFKKLLASPSGIIIISGNNDSGKRSSMYSILKYLSEFKFGDNIVSFEDKIKNNLSFTTQIESKSSITGDIKNFSTIAIDNELSNEDLNKCFEISSKGKLVIAVVDSSSIVNTLNIINEKISNKEKIVENLLSIIHVGLFNKLCESCSYSIKYNKTNQFHNFISLENSPALSDIIKEENCYGCSYCNYGYKDRIQLCEMIENDNILKDLFLNDFNMTNFKIEKRSKSWNSIFENSMILLKSGDISLNSIIKSIGYYKK